MEVGAGSDSPITPIDPMVGVAACESHHDPDATARADEAVRVLTSASARLAHQEDKKGPRARQACRLRRVRGGPARGRRARGLRPVLTVCLGRDVYAA